MNLARESHTQVKHKVDDWFVWTKSHTKGQTVGSAVDSLIQAKTHDIRVGGDAHIQYPLNTYDGGRTVSQFIAAYLQGRDARQDIVGLAAPKRTPKRET
ncbi:MAG: hypothetical protein LBL48_03380 [Azoarcus sp.]|nr:hypothetical protein [Azoarcus sp.]